MFLISRTLLVAPVKRMASSSCIFCKSVSFPSTMDIGNSLYGRIVSKEAPANILFEDDRFVVFPDIRPAAKVHLLVITKVLLQPEREPERAR